MAHGLEEREGEATDGVSGSGIQRVDKIIPPSLGDGVEPGESNPGYSVEFGQMGVHQINAAGTSEQRLAAKIVGKLPVHLRTTLQEYLGTFLDIDGHCIDLMLKDDLMNRGAVVNEKSVVYDWSIYQLEMLQSMWKCLRKAESFSEELLYELLCDNFVEIFLSSLESSAKHVPVNIREDEVLEFRAADVLKRFPNKEPYVKLEVFVKAKMRKLLKGAPVFRELLSSMVECVHEDVKAVVGLEEV